MLVLSVLHILFQVSVVVLVRPNHDKLQIIADGSIGKQIPGRFELELMNEYASQVTLLFFADGWILRFPLRFLSQSFLLGLRYLLDFLLRKCTAKAKGSGGTGAVAGTLTWQVLVNLEKDLPEAEAEFVHEYSKFSSALIAALTCEHGGWEQAASLIRDNERSRVKCLISAQSYLGEPPAVARHSR